MQILPLAYKLRNGLRRVGVEAVPVAANTALLAMHLSMLFSTFEVSCVLDVGAKSGEYGHWLRRNGYRGDIISFEPVKANFGELSQAAARDPHWHCVNYALGSENGQAAINVTSLTQFSSFRQPNVAAETLFGAAPEVRRAEEVDVHRLDAVLDDLPVPATPGHTYLKLDTQGWDLEVLHGAAGVLDRVVALQTEIAVQPIYRDMPLMADSIDTVTKLGFTPSGFFPVNLDERLALVELDLVAVRPDPDGGTREWTGRR